jgi:uncharacterized protein YndB with AHSA1/START domain
MTPGSTNIRCHFSAPPGRVYAALTDPAAIQRWRVPQGMTSQVHSFDAREGGAFRVTLTYVTTGEQGKTSSNSDTYHGRFVRLAPGRLVIEAVEFETDDPGMKGEMKITYRLTETPAGTELHALHENLPPGLSPADNEVGWRMALDNLKKLVEGGPEQ